MLILRRKRAKIAEVVTKITGTIIGTNGSYQNNPATTKSAAFDGNLSTFIDGATSSGNWAGIDAGALFVLKKVAFAPRAVNFAARMVNAEFQISNDATFATYTTVYVISTAPANNVLTTVEISNEISARYVRYYSPPSSYGNIAELEFHGIAA